MVSISVCQTSALGVLTVLKRRQWIKNEPVCKTMWWRRKPKDVSNLEHIRKAREGYTRKGHSILILKVDQKFAHGEVKCTYLCPQSACNPSPMCHFHFLSDSGGSSFLRIPIRWPNLPVFSPDSHPTHPSSSPPQLPFAMNHKAHSDLPSL